MRELEFRAWNAEHKTMVYFDAEKASSDEFIACHFFELMAGIHDSGEGLEQYTGLKDRNGVKIFEGDILYVAGLGNCLVGHYDGFFGFTIESRNNIENIGLSLEDIERVIGNIHENPELIN